MSDHPVLIEAEFDPKVRDYWLWSGTLPFVMLIITIPLAIVYYIIGRLFINQYLARLGCTLTDRTLEIRKGIFNRVESTIPLEKITDLQMFQGPLMRYMGLHGFRVETAGQSVGPGASLVNMVGIVDTPGFRKAVLAQRDRLSSGDRTEIPAAQAPAEGDALLDEVRSIRQALDRLADRMGESPRG
ncbi:MAG: PH domain-containing protein [Planctomycetota bacterium]